MMDTAETHVKAGRLDEALAELQDAVREDPASCDQRVFLFQLLCLLGQWERAMTQLNVAADMDKSNALVAHMYRPALNSEVLRAAVFAGTRTPLVFGEPEEWVTWMIEALRLTATGKHTAAATLREQAFENAPAIAGTIDGEPFEWIADADMRLGPILEIIVNGKYYWMPFGCVCEIKLEPPTDLRDLVWAPAQLTLTNGGTVFGLIPARYPGSEAEPDNRIRMARCTEWREDESGAVPFGVGQRMLATDAGEFPLLEAHAIALHHADAPAAADDVS